MNRKSLAIDVIIPVFNGDKYISSAVKSVMQQTLLPDNIIVIDDGSTDATGQLINSIKKSSVPILYRRQKNSGLSAARNAGIQISQADYLAFLDADDAWQRTKLEKQIQLFKSSQFPRLGVVYADYRFIDSQGNISRKNSSRFRLDKSVKGNIFTRLLVANKIAGSASAVLVKRECFKYAGLFDISLRSYEDFDMWLRIAKHYQFDYVNEVLVGIRRHKENISDNISDLLNARVYFYLKWQSEPLVTRPVLMKWYEGIVYHFSLCLRTWDVTALKKIDHFKLLQLLLKYPFVFLQASIHVLTASFSKRILRKLFL